MNDFPVHLLNSKATFTLSSNLYNHAATLSFWSFIEDNSIFGDKTFSVSFEKRVKIWVGSKIANKIGVWCIPLPDFYQNINNITGRKLSDITTKTQLEAQKADTNKNVLFSELGENKDGLWFNVRCTYSINAKKNYLALHQKDSSAIIYDEQTMKLHNYINNEEIDYPFRDFSSNSIVIDNGGNSSKAIFLKGITAFIDYIPKAALYEYFK